MKTTLTSAIFLLFYFSTAQAQQSVTAAGGEATGNGGTVSYSLGQVVYTNITGTGGSVNQGVQQPYAFLSVGKDEGNNISTFLYPNPTTDLVKIRVEEMSSYDNLSCRLYSLEGKLLLHQKITSAETSVPIHNLALTIYYLQVLEGDKPIKTFKIIKN